MVRNVDISGLLDFPILSNFEPGGGMSTSEVREGTFGTWGGGDI